MGIGNDIEANIKQYGMPRTTADAERARGLEWWWRCHTEKRLTDEAAAGNASSAEMRELLYEVYGRSLRRRWPDTCVTRRTRQHRAKMAGRANAVGRPRGRRTEVRAR